MTLVPDFGIGVAVLTNHSPSEVAATLTWYIIDRLRSREAIDWRQRFHKRREEALLQMRADKEARERTRYRNTRPAHALAAYAGEYQHPAYGVMSIKELGGALHWSWRSMFAPLMHRHYETFELPEVPDRLLPDRLPITFLTDREGNIVSLSTPLEPMVKDIVFARLAAGDCTDLAFRKRCVGRFRSGPTTHRVTINANGQLVVASDYQPPYRLAPLHGRRFRTEVPEGCVVEFLTEGTAIDTAVDEVIFHQPTGAFVAKQVLFVLGHETTPVVGSAGVVSSGRDTRGRALRCTLTQPGDFNHQRRPAQTVRQAQPRAPQTRRRAQAAAVSIALPACAAPFRTEAGPDAAAWG